MDTILFQDFPIIHHKNITIIKQIKSWNKLMIKKLIVLMMT
jgi:hypothetical protein